MGKIIFEFEHLNSIDEIRDAHIEELNWMIDKIHEIFGSDLSEAELPATSKTSSSQLTEEEKKT